jgi:hypothetical protein
MHDDEIAVDEHLVRGAHSKSIVTTSDAGDPAKTSRRSSSVSLGRMPRPRLPTVPARSSVIASLPGGQSTGGSRKGTRTGVEEGLPGPGAGDAAVVDADGAVAVEFEGVVLDVVLRRPCWSPGWPARSPLPSRVRGTPRRWGSGRPGGASSRPLRPAHRTTGHRTRSAQTRRHPPARRPCGARRAHRRPPRRWWPRRAPSRRPCSPCRPPAPEGRRPRGRIGLRAAGEQAGRDRRHEHDPPHGKLLAETGRGVGHPCPRTGSSGG